MTNRMLHTPEGVRDIYNAECARKRILMECLDRKIRSYGYHPIQTPSYEFFDIFSREIGTTPSRELFKFFDREGNTLVLRPDMTPSVARAASKYYSEESIPLRFCYLGNTYINHSSHQGRLRESTQIGAELIGADDAGADAELIALTIASFLEAGITEFQITVGHVGFYHALCDAAGIFGEAEGEIRDLICSKNYYAASEILERIECPAQIRDLFRDFSVLNGTDEMLRQTLARAAQVPGAPEAIGRLLEIYALLEVYGYAKYVSFDLSFLSKYGYYTGVIFEGYTYGSGEALAKGGRYDDLLSHFGKEAPAVGSVIMVDTMMTAMQRQGIVIPIPGASTAVFYHSDQAAAAIRTAADLRAAGKTAALLCIADTQTAADYTAAIGRFHYTDVVDLTTE